MHPIVVFLLILLAVWILTPKRRASRIDFICGGCRAKLQIGAGSAGTYALHLDLEAVQEEFRTPALQTF
jgi:hypothetical protein